ncbi:MAG: polymer-forming cytoskeletal protein [Patescibacteria group bacterium]|nr:polymer-forming cytoskeletal protein [Patescibacteria group bacterium]
MKTKIIIFAFSLLLLLPVGFVSAYDIRSTEGTTTIESTETVQDDLMIAGQSVQIDGVISGDVYAVGQTVTVSSNAKILGNLFTAGQIINIDGIVEGDLFTAGANVNITGSVKNGIMAFAGMISVAPKATLDSNNATFFGGTIDISKNANFSRDMIANGGAINYKGTVDNNLTINGGTVDVSGLVKKDATITASEKMVFNSGAKVDGNLNYSSPKQAEFKNGSQVVGETKFTQLVETQKKAGKKNSMNWFAMSAFKVVTNFISMISLMIVAIVTAAICKKYSLNVIDKLKTKTWASLGWGLLVLFVTPIAFIILLITILGMPIAFLILPIYLVLIYFAKVFATICTGYFILKSIGKNEPNLIWSAVLGVIVLSIIMMIPFIGFLAKLAVISLGIGAMVLALKAYHKNSSAKA